MSRKISFSPPDITDREVQEVADALRSGWITTGPRTKKFESVIADFVGTVRCACLNSATAAMELTLRILGVGPGDEVVTTPYTYSASAAVIEHVGAKIVFVDLQKDSYEMDYDAMARAVTEKTKVIIPVDIGGRMCDYRAIYRALEGTKSPYRPNNAIQALYPHAVVLSDAAHAFGAERDGQTSGMAADFTCFSFHAIKNLTTAEGGAAVWRSVEGLDDEWVYQQYMLHSLHGQNKDALAKATLGGWEYDIVFPGYKCNMTDILAGLGLIQFERYAELNARRRQIIAIYDMLLKPAGFLPLNHFEHGPRASTGHLYMVRVPGADEAKRNAIITKMGERGIPTNVHYKPLPMMTAYKNLGFQMEDYPNAYAQYQNEISLPLHTLLTDDDTRYIAEHFIEVAGA